MYSQRKKRYGLLTISVFMFLLTIIFGTKGSVYAAFWIYAAFLSYRGDVVELLKWLKILIIINLAFGIGYFYFGNFQDVEWLPPFLRDKYSFIAALFFPLLIKIGMFLYIKQLSSDNLSNLSKLSRNFNTVTDTIKVEDSAWVQALKEVEGTDKNMATWAKVLAESDGNIDLARSLYIKQRANHLQLKYTIESNFITNEQEFISNEKEEEFKTLERNRTHMRYFWNAVTIVLIIYGLLVFSAIKT